MTESEIDRLAEDFRAELISDEEEDLLDIEDNEAATVPPPRPHHHLARSSSARYVSLSTLVMLKR